MIRFVCECGRELQAREEDAGKLVICPACQRQLTAPAESPPPERVQQERPIRREEPEREEEQEIEDHLRRQPAGNSGKAIASLVLGILSLFCNVLAGVPALILGILALRDIGRSRGRLSGQGLAIAGIITACACTLLSCVSIVPIGLLLPAVQKVREAAERAQSANNLMQLTIAVQSYNAQYGSLPPAGLGDPNKPLAAQKPLLSWRVALLPFLGENLLYSQFKLDEPWDSPHNIQLLKQMPNVYKCPAVPTQAGYTVYQVFVGNGAAFEKTKPTRIPADFPDGTSLTILIVEAAKPVPWTKPEDIDFDPQKPIKPLLSSHDRRGFLVGLADGSTQYVTPDISESTLKAAITRNGQEPLKLDWWSR